MNVDALAQRPQPAGSSGAADTAFDYVRDLQRDGRLLLRHVARRSDRALGVGDGFAAATGPGFRVLTEDPALITTDSARLEALATCVDVLSRQVAPANVATIRLTSAYLRMASEGGEPPSEVVVRARKLRRMMQLIIAIAVLATFLSVVLLAHVDDGRRAVQQLREVRADLATTYRDLGALPNAAWVQRGGSGIAPELTGTAPAYAPFCEGAAPGVWREPALTETGARAQALCSQRYEAALREALVYQRLAAWNCNTYALFTLGGLLGGARADNPQDRCGVLPQPPARPPMSADGSDWPRTEIRTAATISVLTGFVLPLLLGCVGGCAYALRRLDQKLSEWTLEVRDGSQLLLRVLLATMLGGLLGVVWSSDQPVQLGGFTLSLAAAAFFVGFALEVVFSVIEAMVEGVAGKLRSVPPPPPAPGPVAAVRSPPPAAS
jgi:hypothetical protein